MHHTRLTSQPVSHSRLTVGTKSTRRAYGRTPLRHSASTQNIRALYYRLSKLLKYGNSQLSRLSNNPQATQTNQRQQPNRCSPSTGQSARLRTPQPQRPSLNHHTACRHPGHTPSSVTRSEYRRGRRLFLSILWACHGCMPGKHCGEPCGPYGTMVNRGSRLSRCTMWLIRSQARVPYSAQAAHGAPESQPCAIKHFLDGHRVTRTSLRSVLRAIGPLGFFVLWCACACSYPSNPFFCQE